MSGVSAYVRMLVVILVVGLLAGSSGSQELPGRVVGTGTAQLSFTGGPNEFASSADVFVGNDARGPYTLNWKNINRFTDTVAVDNRLLQRDSDYQIDYAAGTITFASPVSSKTIIRAEYSYDTTKAVRNGAPLSMPLTLDIFKKGDQGLQFTALYRQPESGTNTTPDVVVYGLTGQTKSKGNEVNSMLLFSPDRTGTGQGQSSDLSALKLGSSTKTDNLQLTTSFLHVGEQFAGSKDYQLQQGLDAMNLAMVFTPGKTLLMSSSFNRTANSVGEKKGQTLATSEQKIVLTPDGAPALTMVHGVVEKGQVGAATQATTTDRLQLDSTLGNNVTAQAVHQTVDTNIGGTDTSVSTNQLNLSAKPTGNMAIQGQLTQQSSSTDGGQTGIGLNVQASPTKTMTLNAGFSQVDADKTGQANAQSLHLAANPNARFNLEMNLAHKDTDQAGSEFTHMLKVSSALRPDTKLEFGMTGTDVQRPADQSSQALKLSTTALRNSAVFIDLSQQTSDVNGLEDFGGIRIETTPAKSIKIGGALSEHQSATSHDLNREARLEVQPFDNTTVGGAYRETETNGQVVARTSEVSASTKPSSFIQFSGAYKNRQTAGQEDLNTTNLALTLDTGRTVKFTGAFSSNPEDAKGVVLRQNSQTLGLRTDFGRLKVKGAYTLNDLYLAGKRGETREFGVDYRLSTYSLLTTGYSLDEQQDASLLQTSVYSLGYTHAIGSRLNLYLGGKMTTYQKDQLMMGNPDYEAEARLGLKF